MMSLAAALLAMLSLQSAPSGVPDALSPHAPDCALDLPAMLALDEMHFDQDRTTGWRMVQARGCATEAADLLQAYRTAHPTARAGILFWHEGQVRATIGQTDRAIALFEQARRPPDADALTAASIKLVGVRVFVTLREAHGFHEIYDPLPVFSLAFADIVDQEGLPDYFGDRLPRIEG